MKKKLLTAALLALSTSLIFADVPRFSDVKAADWFSDTVIQLTARGGITGYDDGTFRPAGTITRAEYTSIVARSLGIQAKEGVTGHWSAGIMASATEVGLVKYGEFGELDKPITRNEMARMAVRAVAYQKETVPSDYTDYAPLITDLSSAGTYKDDVTKVVAMGIISGYPDKTFQGSKTLSRAEASVVVIRILDKDARKVPAKPSAPGTIALGEVKPLADILPQDANTRLFTMFDMDKVTLLDAAAYAPQTYTRTAGGLGIMFKGHCGRLLVIQDNRVVDSAPELWVPALGYSKYDSAYWQTADYYGLLDGSLGTLKMIPNPWKN